MENSVVDLGRFVDRRSVGPQPEDVLPKVSAIRPALYQTIDNLAARYRDLLGLDVHDARSDRVKRACIQIFQSWRGEELILEEGMSTETVIAETDDGSVIKKEVNHLHRYTLERDCEARQILSDLGAFDQN